MTVLLLMSDFSVFQNLVGGIFFFPTASSVTQKSLIHGEACARSHQRTHGLSCIWLASHWSPGATNRMREPRCKAVCVKYSNMHVRLCPRALLILLNVNNNEWFLPQDTSEPLKLCFIYVSAGAGCVEKADIANKSLDTTKEGWGDGVGRGDTGESGWKWSTLQIDQFVWGYIIRQEGPASSVRCSGPSVFPQSDLWPYLKRSIYIQAN